MHCFVIVVGIIQTVSKLSITVSLTAAQHCSRGLTVHVTAFWIGKQVSKQFHNLTVVQIESDKIFKSNRNVSNPLIIPQIELPDVLKSRFKFQSWFGFAYHWCRELPKAQLGLTVCTTSGCRSCFELRCLLTFIVCVNLWKADLRSVIWYWGLCSLSSYLRQQGGGCVIVLSFCKHGNWQTQKRTSTKLVRHGKGWPSRSD